MVEWYDYAKWLLEWVENFPKSQRFVLGQRLTGQAMDVLDLLVEASYARSRAVAALCKRQALQLEMAKTHKRLWGKVVNLGNLMRAAHLAMRGKRSLVPDKYRLCGALAGNAA